MEWAHILKLGLAMLLGGLIGAEREIRDKSAGLRTIMLIAVGSALFTIISLSIRSEPNPTRIAANIVVGIGFVGAGVILQEGQRITGLTTAATIWLAAAVGMAVGAGEYILAISATVLVLLVLRGFLIFERWLDRTHEIATYEISMSLQSPRRKGLKETFSSHGLQVQQVRERKSGDTFTIVLRARGHPEGHRKALEALLQDPEVRELLRH